MTDAKQNELILLYLYGELSSDEKEAFEKELSQDRLLKEEFEIEKELHQLYSDRTGTEVPDSVLFESRRKLMNTLNADYSGGTGRSGIIGFLFGNNPKLAGVFAMLFIGIFLGKAVDIEINFGDDLVVTDFITARSSNISADLLELHGLEIADLNIHNYDAQTGEIILTLDAVSSLGIKGNINNLKIQTLLAAALQSNLGPSTRLKTVDLLRVNSKEKKISDALIFALKNDDNPGVRLKAAEALSLSHFNKDIMNALLQALSLDDNNGVRIQAIEALKKFNDKEVTDLLKQKMISDENEYIRFLLEEHFSDEENEKTEREI